MKTFKQFLAEDQTWKKIDQHYDNLSTEHKNHVDRWGGISPHGVKQGQVSGMMDSHDLEKNWQDVHKANEPIRSLLQRKYGTHITAYRGTRPGSGYGSGRLGTLHSWTTDKNVAAHFAGAPEGGRMNRHSEEDIQRYEKEFHSTGKVKIGNHTIIKNPNSEYHDIHDRHGSFVTDTSGPREYANDENETIDHHNEKHDTAMKNVVKKRIAVNDVVHATNHMGQKELIVKHNE